MEWYFANESTLNAGSAFVPQPPPLPSFSDNDNNNDDDNDQSSLRGLPLPQDNALCPICMRKRTNEAVVSVY
jgi:hypothetical protein